MAQTLVDLSEWLNSLPIKLEPQQLELQKAAEHQLERIKTRTASGIGVDGQIFAPYSPATRKEPPVNLRKTGEMLDSLAVNSDDNSARIYFDDDDAHQKAIWNQEGTKKIPARPFMGVSPADREEILEDVLHGVLARMNG